MADLIRANLFRLVHSRLFWLLVTLSVVPGICFMLYAAPILPQGEQELELYDVPTNFWGLLNVGPIALAYAASLMCPSFDGTEYSAGTIRNKLTRGCARNAVFFSSLIVELVAIGILLATYYAPYLPLLDLWNMDGVADRGWSLPDLMVTAALCAVCFTCLFHLVGSLLPGRASAVAAPAVLIALTIVSFSLRVAMLQPEMNTVITTNSTRMEDGSLQEEHITQALPNPAYITPNRRPAFEFWERAIPSGAAICGLTEDADRSYWAYLSVECAILVATGAVAFSRHNVN